MDTIKASVLSCANEVSTEWLNAVLKQTGKIKSSITAVDVEIFGEGVGLMAELARLQLSFEQPESFPASLVIKCAAQNQNREVALALDFYNREVNFYAKIGNDGVIQVPAIHFSAVEAKAYNQTILMEDLISLHTKDQLVGATADESFAAVELIAKMHGQYWGRAGQNELAWMYATMSHDESIKLQQAIYLPSMESAFEVFADFFNDETRNICRIVGQRFPDFFATKENQVETFVHGDYRQDNIMYASNQTAPMVIDWQISGAGRGIFDLAYFMSQSLNPKIRREIEVDVIRMWVGKLENEGVKGYSFDEAYEDYRHLLLACLIYPITVCGTLDGSNERGRMLGECMLERNLQAVLELNCAELF